MKLTLEQAASRLGKSVRQVRYLVRKGELPAEKIAGRWFVDSDDLPLDEPRQQTKERRQRQLQAAVEEALDIESEGERQKRYSVFDLKAFQIALPLYRKTCAELSEDHTAAVALRRTLEHLSRGCHRFDLEAKAECYRAARDEASLAICELALSEAEAAHGILYALEQDLMAALAGLMRRVDRGRRQRL